MKKFKAILALLLALCFVLSAAACGKTEDESKDDTAANATPSDAESSTGDDGSSIGGSEDNTSDSGNDSSVPDSDSDVIGRDPGYVSLNYDNMKGIWISQYDTAIFKANDKQRDKNNYKSRVDKICKGIADNGFNTVILQVRPFGDSFYPSEIYTPSSFVVGAYGKDFTYDPFKIFIDAAHKYNLSVHAWINPMRLMTATEIQKVSTDYVIGEWYQNEELRNKFFYLYENRYYLIPSYEETRKLVADGAAEICRNYNVDGVHIDDYFYPTTNPAFDAAHYEGVKEDYGSLGSYRLEKVNQLVNGIYKAVKGVKEDILFGISPAGSINNNMSSLYADVKSWGSKKGFCDYLAPQVYWGFEIPRESEKFDVCTEAWEAICKEPSVKLVIGMGIYRANGPSSTGDFAEYYENKDVIKRQLEYLEGRDRVSGFIMYSFQDLFDDYGRDRAALKEERENFLPVLKAFGE